MFRAITGPTGIGKTELALRLAVSKPGLQLVNADAFQFYRELKIISNREDFPPTLRTHFFGDRSLGQATSAGEFAKTAQSLLDESALWVGTGLYLCAALYGLDADRRKGTPFQVEAKRPFKMIVLDEDRQLLYEGLNQRVDFMLKRGALAEAEAIFEQIKNGSLNEGLPGLKAIGLRQLLQHLRSEVSLEQAVASWKQESRRLAKRQWTWLRKFCPPSPNSWWLRRSEALKDLPKVAEFLDI